MTELQIRRMRDGLAGFMLCNTVYCIESGAMFGLTVSILAVIINLIPLSGE